MHVIGGSKYGEVFCEDFGRALRGTDTLHVCLGCFWGDFKEHLSQPECTRVVQPKSLGVENPYSRAVVVIGMLMLVGPMHLKNQSVNPHMPVMF